MKSQRGLGTVGMAVGGILFLAALLFVVAWPIVKWLAVGKILGWW